MRCSGPGHHYREGLSLIQVMDMFPTAAAAESWFAEARWPEGVRCPHCHSDNVQNGAAHPSQPYRCRACRKRFSVKTGTVMEASNLDCRKWAIAIYLFNTSIKGVSSMALHRALGITQKSAWHMAHRIRESWDSEHAPFSGPVEVDEAYIGGKERNKHAHKRRRGTQGGAGKAILAGMRDRATSKVAVDIVPSKHQSALTAFIVGHTREGATVYTDESQSYARLAMPHESVSHSIGEYVRGEVSTNGIESFWASFKRGYHGIYHQMSRKHLHRYVREFVGRHNRRRYDTVDLLTLAIMGMVGKRLRYADLVETTIP